MYTVVVCPNCEYCWIVDDRPDRTTCGRCSKSHQFSKLRKFHSTEDTAEAKQARQTVRANVIDDTEGFERAKEAGNLNIELDNAIDEEEYLKEKGMNTAALADVEERATSGTATVSKPQPEIVRDAITDGGAESESDVVEYAVERDVPPDAAKRIFSKLRDQGDLVKTQDGLRLI